MITLPEGTVYGDPGTGVAITAFDPAEHLALFAELALETQFGAEDYVKASPGPMFIRFTEFANSAMFTVLVEGEPSGILAFTDIVFGVRAEFHGWGKRMFPRRLAAAARLAVDYAFNEWGLQVLTACHAAANKPATWACRELGFKKEARIDKYCLHGGKLRAAEFFSLSREV